MISDNFVQELLAKTDIASLIGEYTTLTPKGGKLWACCPFHNEKTPSFKVDTTTQLYYCFGCHKGGNAITFLKEKENLSGFEAMQSLCERVGMEMPNSGFSREEAEKQKNARQRLYNANREAARYYYECMKDSEKARDYLKKRSLSENIITRFGLGFAPDSWTSLYDHLKTLGYTDDEIINAGLAKKAESGRVFDFFRNRIIFPIIDEKGNVLAFGGRTMGDDKPKYLNTGDTPIYNKKNNVYALNMLKKGTHNDLIIVEGYMDVISLHSVGVDNAVATLGTALTENQARLLKRRTTRIYVSYDGDSAGQNATMRGLDILANEGLEVRVISLPDGLDPDDFAKKYGSEGYMRLKDHSLALNTFKLEHISKEYDFDDEDSRQKFAIRACEMISRLQPVEQERYYEYVSRKTGISYSTLSAQGSTSRLIPEKRNNFAQISNNREKAPTFAKTEQDRYELLMAACAAASEKAAVYLIENAEEFIENKSIHDFIALAAASYSDTGKCDIAVLISQIDGDTSAITASIFEQHIDEPLKSAKDCVKRMQLLKLETELLVLSQRLDSHDISANEYKLQCGELTDKIRQLK